MLSFTDLSFYNRYKLTSLFISVQIVLIYKYIKYKLEHHQRHLNNVTDKDKFKKMFITDKNRLCLPHLNTRMICGSHCSYLSLRNLINMINNAKETLSICMYHFSIDDLHHAIINAHNRGVKIRILSDTVMLSSTGSKLKYVCKNDIPVKTPKSKIGLMHHKFMLIDEHLENTQVLFGSLNFTINAFINNWEFVVLTDNIKIIHRFKDEFNELWANPNFEFIKT